MLTTPALRALADVTAHETSANSQHCLALVQLPAKPGVRLTPSMRIVQFRPSPTKDVINGQIAGCTLRNRQAQPIRALLGLLPRVITDDSPTYNVLETNHNFAGMGYNFVVPGGKSQARATEAAARDPAAHQAGARRYLAERLSNPERSAAEARAASGVSAEEARTGGQLYGLKKGVEARCRTEARYGTADEQGCGTEEAVAMAHREQLTLTPSSNSKSGFQGVTECTSSSGTKSYKGRYGSGGAPQFIQTRHCTTAAEAALLLARALAVRSR